MSEVLRVTSDRANRRLLAIVGESLVPWYAPHTSDTFYRLNDWIVERALAPSGVVRPLAEFPMRRGDGRRV